ncbi:UNVERIFIED_ORG: hypothetical protein ABIC77_000344 [Stenotrophomonas geniculata]
MQKYDVVLREEFLAMRELRLSVFGAQPPSTVSDLDGATGLSCYGFPESGDEFRAVELESQSDGAVVVLDSANGEKRFRLQPGDLVLGGQVTFVPVVDRGQPAASKFTVVTIN